MKVNIFSFFNFNNCGDAGNRTLVHTRNIIIFYMFSVIFFSNRFKDNTLKNLSYPVFFQLNTQDILRLVQLSDVLFLGVEQT